MGPSLLTYNMIVQLVTVAGKSCHWLLFLQQFHSFLLPLEYIILTDFPPILTNCVGHMMPWVEINLFLNWFQQLVSLLLPHGLLVPLCAWAGLFFSMYFTLLFFCSLLFKLMLNSSVQFNLSIFYTPFCLFFFHFFGVNVLQKSDNTWKKSRTNYIMSSYLQPLLLWTGAMLICRYFEEVKSLRRCYCDNQLMLLNDLHVSRALDPLILQSEASQAVKQRLLNFVQSLSTVLAFAYCLSRYVFLPLHLMSFEGFAIAFVDI